jgi:phosphate transport system substrate-binding protein
MVLGLFASANQIKIVGSSTVYPFSSAIAEEFGATTKYKTPIVESTGSGGGMKLFCAGSGKNTPDITNASRKMKTREFKKCVKNGVKNITEYIIGFDGIAFAQSKSNKKFNITIKELMLATAAMVPTKNGKSLIKNPYTNWNQINKNLPNRKIVIYGPPKSSGTRDAFEDMVLKHTCKKIKAYTNMYKKDKKKYRKYKKYHTIRTDGVYIPSGENDNLIVAKLSKNKNAFGIFGYSFLLENEDKLNGATINGKLPTPNNISNGTYPISRSLYFYTKNSHFKTKPSMSKFVSLFMSESMVGDKGFLSELGLIPLPKKRRVKARKNSIKKIKLKLRDLR